MPNLYNYRATFISADKGDTITTDIDLGFGAWLYHEKLELLGIYSPELEGKERPQGIAARDFVRALLTEGDAIEITTYKDAINTDSRWQADVTLSDGRSLNQVLLDADYAKPK